MSISFEKMYFVGLIQNIIDIQNLRENFLHFFLIFLSFQSPLIKPLIKPHKFKCHRGHVINLYQH